MYPNPMPHLTPMRWHPMQEPPGERAIEPGTGPFSKIGAGLDADWFPRPGHGRLRSLLHPAQCPAASRTPQAGDIMSVQRAT
jgi:hypothetical protein